jgi:hypothetical protein
LFFKYMEIIETIEMNHFRTFFCSLQSPPANWREQFFVFSGKGVFKWKKCTKEECGEIRQVCPSIWESIDPIRIAICVVITKWSLSYWFNSNQ